MDWSSTSKPRYTSCASPGYIPPFCWMPRSTTAQHTAGCRPSDTGVKVDSPDAFAMIAMCRLLSSENRFAARDGGIGPLAGLLRPEGFKRLHGLPVLVHRKVDVPTGSLHVLAEHPLAVSDHFLDQVG